MRPRPGSHVPRSVGQQQLQHKSGARAGGTRESTAASTPTAATLRAGSETTGELHPIQNSHFTYMFAERHFIYLQKCISF